MKKIIISLFSLILVIGVSNLNACETCGCKENDKVTKTEKECPFTKNADGQVVCVKTGKVCNKDTKSCCKTDAESAATKCSKGKAKKCCKSKKKGFNYGKSNNYGSKSKSTCSGSKKQATIEEVNEEETIEEETPSEE